MLKYWYVVFMKNSISKEICSCSVIHPEAVERVRQSMPDDEILTHMADFFKICGDKTRIKILHALLSSELCVCDLSALCNLSISSISHQLSLLRRARLVKNRKDGQVVYYSLSDHHVRGIFSKGKEHVME